MNPSIFQGILTFGWFLWMATQLATSVNYAMGAHVTGGGLLTLTGGLLLPVSALGLSLSQCRAPTKGRAIAMAIVCGLILIKYYLSGVLIHMLPVGGGHSFTEAVLLVCDIHGGPGKAGTLLALILVSGLFYPCSQFLLHRRTGPGVENHPLPPRLPAEYMEAIHGAHGLIYYSYADLLRDSRFGFEKRWADMLVVGKEVKQLEPALLSTGGPPRLEVQAPSGVHFAIRADDARRTFVLMANPESQEALVRIAPPKQAVLHLLHRGALRLWEQRDSESTTTLRLPPMGSMTVLITPQR